MTESDGSFYVYSTGGGSKSSLDGLFWTNGPKVFPGGFPKWLTTLLPSNQGLWAPDVIHLNNQYYLYYSVCGVGTKACAIGLVTSPTLNPNSPGYKWVDHGLVVANDEVVNYGAIDPAPILDASNDLWVVWGGGYTNPTTAQSIWVTRMDNVTGVPSAADPAKPGHPLELGHKEGSYLHYHGEYYYLFWQTGGCCSGVASTYTINMARSKSITGPFTGDRVFYKSHDDVHGPGHIGIYSACGAERFTYHYYPNDGSILGENELSWEADGWPVPGAASTTPLQPCADTGHGGAGGGGGTASASSAQSSAEASGSRGASGSSGASGSGDATGSGGRSGSLVAAAGGSGEDPAPVSTSSASAGGSSGSGAGSESSAACSCSFPGDQGRQDDGRVLFAAAGLALASVRRRRR